MDQTIFQYIASLGFPIVSCAAMAFFIVKRSQANDEKIDQMRKEQREDLARIQAEHKTEVDKMTEAINNNTLAMQRLTDKLDK